MRIAYLHPYGSGLLSAPSGKSYEFKPDAGGPHRVAEVADLADARWFLKLEGHGREYLFEQLDDPEPEFEDFDPDRRNYDKIGVPALRVIYRQRIGKAAPPNMREATLIAALRAVDADADALAKPQPDSAPAPPPMETGSAPETKVPVAEPEPEPEPELELVEGVPLEGVTLDALMGDQAGLETAGGG